MAPAGNFSSGLLSSWRQATSGRLSSSQCSSRSIRPFTPLTLKVAIFTEARLSFARFGSPFAFVFALALALAFVAPPSLDRTGELDRHRQAVAVDRLAGLDPDPAFRSAIFLDVLAHPSLEADADAALQRFHVEMLAARIVRQTIGGRIIGHQPFLLSWIQASTRSSSTSSGTAPFSSTTEWNWRMSKRSPSASRARSRSSRIRSWPIM